MKQDILWKEERVEQAPTVELGIYYEPIDSDKRLFLREEKENIVQEDILFEDDWNEEVGKIVFSWKAENTEQILNVLISNITEVLIVKRGIAVFTGNYSIEEAQKAKEIVKTHVKILKIQPEVVAPIAKIDLMQQVSLCEKKMVYIEMFFSMKNRKKEDIFASVLLGSILGEGDGSLLGYYLREERGYTDEIEMNLWKEGKKLYLGFYFWVRGNAYEHVLEIVNMIINKALGEIKEKDLIAVKRSYIQGLRQLEDDTWSWNQRIGMGYLNGSVDGIDRKKQMQGYESVEFSQIEELCRDYIKKDNMKIHVIAME